MIAHRTIPVILRVAVLFLLCRSEVNAADWSAYAHDGGRSGVTTENLSFPLARIWTYEPTQKPCPAWPEPGKELHRLDFDYAPQPIISGDLVYFGSTSDNTLRALRLETGGTKWRFTTGGPIRFAPAIADDMTYVVSDDGWIYALRARTGKLVWKFPGAPREDWILGNERMISRWPIRSGVLVETNVVYFAAGMWPAEGIYVYALDAKTGEQIWCNDSSGSMYRKHPHRSSSAFSGVSPQGYVMASDSFLFIPSGRTTPAAYDKMTGELKYYQPYLYEYPYNSEGAINRGSGGWWGTIAAGFLINSMHRGGGPNLSAKIGESDPRPGDGIAGYSLETGLRQWRLAKKHRVLFDKGVIYAVGNGELQAIDLNRREENGDFDDSEIWSSPQPRTYCLAKAGKSLLAGGRDSLAAFDAANGRNIWKTSISGQVRGIAVANGHVVVSTSEGTIACFEKMKRGLAPRPRTVCERLTWKSPPDAHLVDLAASAIKQSGISQGYALVAGQEDSRLAEAIASQTEMHVVNLLQGDALLNADRKRLLTTDMHGSRVVSMAVDASTNLYCPSFFADLVVVSKGVDASMMPELYRALRPCGGVICFPGVGKRQAKRLIKKSGSLPDEISLSHNMPVIVRGKLPGAGDWRYPWADGGKSGIGKDVRTKPPFDLLWFGGPGPGRMMNRHWDGPPPLSVDGRVFVAGQHHVIAIDAYNGRELWSHRLEGAARKDTLARSSNFVADDDSVYVAIGPVCHRLDQTTGKRLAVYTIPHDSPEEDPGNKISPDEKDTEATWGFLSATDGLLLGTTLNDGAAKRPYRGGLAFALNKKRGTTKWIHTSDTRLLSYPAAFGNDRLFLVETSSTNDLSRLVRRGEEPSVEHSVIALDIRTGEMLWRQDDLPPVTYDIRGGIEDCSIQYSDGVVVLHGGRAAYKATTGQKLWEQEEDSRGGRVILGKWLIGQETSIALHTGQVRMTTDAMTGERKPWRFARSFGCGPVAGSRGVLCFRSGTAGFYDMANQGLSTYGGIRPGCSINMIPANGLLTIPEGSSGCTCSYNFQTSLALIPGDRRNDYWYVVSGEYSDYSTKRFKANFGAPGDQRDSGSTPWLAFPRPQARRVAPIPLSVVANSPDYYYRRPAPGNSVGQGESPWVYTSGLRGAYTLCINLEPQRSVFATTCAQAPKIDGKLDDPCWKTCIPLSFDGCAEKLSPKTTVLISKDSTNFYLAYRKGSAMINGSPIPFRTDFSDDNDSRIDKDDHFALHVTDEDRRTSFYCAIGCGGGAVDGITDLANDEAPNTWWSGDWGHATFEDTNEWSAEISIPFEMLRKKGIAPDSLQMNLLSQEVSRHGCGRIYLRDPRAFFLFCRAFAPIVDRSPDYRKHTYTVRLHFAEPDLIEEGDRVFDVALQGKTVLEDFDIVREAGGPNRALVKTFRNVAAREKMSLALIAHSNEEAMLLPPILCGMELEREKR